MKKNIRLIVVLSIVIFIVSRGSTLFKFHNRQIDLYKTLNDVPTWDGIYDGTFYYFIYNNKIYYYQRELNLNVGEAKENNYFFEADLDGTNNKLICKSDELYGAYFYFVYENEAYFRNMLKCNKKINLSTGKITQLDIEDTIIPSTFMEDGTVNTFYDCAVTYNPYVVFNKIDLKTGKVILNNKLYRTSLAGNKYLINQESGDIYDIETFNRKKPMLRINGKDVYELDSKKSFFTVYKNNLYLYDSANIYKFNMATMQIEKTIAHNLGEFDTILYGNRKSLINYVYSNEKIYQYDIEKDSFNVIIESATAAPDYVYSFNEKVVFTEGTDNIKYNTERDNLGKVIIYYPTSKRTETIKNVRKACFDENFLYVMISENESYKVDKIDLKYEN